MASWHIFVDDNSIDDSVSMAPLSRRSCCQLFLDIFWHWTTSWSAYKLNAWRTMKMDVVRWACLHIDVNAMASDDGWIIFWCRNGMSFCAWALPGRYTRYMSSWRCCCCCCCRHEYIWICISLHKSSAATSINDNWRYGQMTALASFLWYIDAFYLMSINGNRRHLAGHGINRRLNGEGAWHESYPIFYLFCIFLSNVIEDMLAGQAGERWSMIGVGRPVDLFVDGLSARLIVIRTSVMLPFLRSLIYRMNRPSACGDVDRSMCVILNVHGPFALI